MTVRVNLLPIEHQRRAKRPRRMKRWVALAVGLLVGEALSAIYLTTRASETREMLGQIERLRQSQDELRKEMAALSVQKNDLTLRVALNEQLRRKHLWSRTLTTLTSHLPEHVVLVRLSSEPSRDTETVVESIAPAALKGLSVTRRPSAPSGSTAMGLTIDGIATDHSSVAFFLDTLDHHPELGSGDLKSTSRQPFMDDHGVAFSIVTRW